MATVELLMTVSDDEEQIVLWELGAKPRMNSWGYWVTHQAGIDSIHLGLSDIEDDQFSGLAGTKQRVRLTIEPVESEE